MGNEFVNFDLPRSEKVQLITWKFIENNVKEDLHNIDDSIGNINVSLTAIDNRIKEWLAEQSEG